MYMYNVQLVISLSLPGLPERCVIFMSVNSEPVMAVLGDLE